jgi:methanogenic corrinoid protein MtbC1
VTKNLSLALADFDEDFVLETIKTRLKEGNPSISILVELQQGMALVGERYDKKEYYLFLFRLISDYIPSFNINV